MSLGMYSGDSLAPGFVVVTLRVLDCESGHAQTFATTTEHPSVEAERFRQQIDSLEKSEVKWIDHSEYRELFPLFLIPAILMVITEMILTQTRLRRVP